MCCRVLTCLLCPSATRAAIPRAQKALVRVVVSQNRGAPSPTNQSRFQFLWLNFLYGWCLFLAMSLGFCYPLLLLLCGLIVATSLLAS